MAGEYEVYHSEYTMAQIQASIGKNPIIQDGTWRIWDIATSQYVDTGLTAKGDKGDTPEITFDSSPTVGSENPVTSGGVYTALKNHYVTAGQFPNTTPGAQATAEGFYNQASGRYSHAEGSFTMASGQDSHAEGAETLARGNGAHAEGGGCQATGYASHAEGASTIAASANQHVSGKYNIADSAGTYAEIIGNGVEYDKEAGGEVRSNARTLDWNGNEWLAGKLTIETPGTGDNDAVTHSQMQAAIKDNVPVIVDISNRTPDENDFELLWNAWERGIPGYIKADKIKGRSKPLLLPLIWATESDLFKNLCFSAGDLNDIYYAEFAHDVSGDGAADDWTGIQQVTLARLASPTLTGTPRAPTAAVGTNTTQIATTAFVQAAIQAALAEHGIN